ncbi:hypothetical protein HL658_11290 [Azospirillum sp. RWY-5-1]|uniref:Uncharacterized protein n=1 Tax=Azospirillum oleiclasticum TaxID=2735135 RepID=A0ABX2T7Y0_9PROT|nr:hypothetical protein [Azospirillum oleiclasticum]NYZ13140.1 hypothetical protein [Azospirillum oleiclasticum]NYZ20187.1 hypothetical protein [Azospirillum oleiclasticum]
MKHTIKSMVARGASVAMGGSGAGQKAVAPALTPEQQRKASKLVDRISQDIAQKGWVNLSGKP